MPDFKTALYNEVNGLNASAALVGTEPLYVATAPSGFKGAADLVKDLVRKSDPLVLTRSLQADAFNATIVPGDYGYRRMWELFHHSDGTGINPTFSTIKTFQINQTSTNGNYHYGNGTTDKTTYVTQEVTGRYWGSGQRFIQGLDMVGFGMGDVALWGNNKVRFAGGPYAGDEGQAFQLFSTFFQQDYLVQDQITAVYRSALTTTTTQAIGASKDSQSVTVASVAGALVGDWVIVERAIQSGANVGEAVRIEAIGPGNAITGKFTCNHASGVTITPALVLTLQGYVTVPGYGDAYPYNHMGQHRLLVNLTGTSYTTGQAHGTGTGALTGTGTAWTVDMVGGDALNIGAITMAADDVTCNPYNSGSRRLRCWHPVVFVSSNTSLAIHSLSVANDTSYKGRQTSPGSYIIRPSAQIKMMVDDGAGNPINQIVCDTSTHTWSVGDVVECTICPYPDVSGYIYNLAVATPCGTIRSFLDILQNGSAMWGTGIRIGRWGGANPLGVDGTDPTAWDTCLDIGVCNRAINIGGVLKDTTVPSHQRGVNAGIVFEFGPAAPANAPHMVWGNGNVWLETYETSPGSGDGGFRWKMVASPANTGILTTAPDPTAPMMEWDGMFCAKPRGVAQLPAASNSLKGYIATVTDSSVTTWGSTVAGGGSSTVLVFCNGSAWKVFAA